MTIIRKQSLRSIISNSMLHLPTISYINKRANFQFEYAQNLGNTYKSSIALFGKHHQLPNNILTCQRHGFPYGVNATKVTNSISS